MQPKRFCPFCGQPTKPVTGTPHRNCSDCGETDYQNPAPAVCVAAIRDGKILLSLRAREPKKGQWDLVGGFVDVGENVEEAAHREVREETGCTLLDLRLHATAPGDYAGQPTLNFLHTATLVGEPVAADDSADLKWWPLDQVPPIAWKHEADFVRSLRP